MKRGENNMTLYMFEICLLFSLSLIFGVFVFLLLLFCSHSLVCFDFIIQLLNESTTITSTKKKNTPKISESENEKHFSIMYNMKLWNSCELNLNSNAANCFCRMQLNKKLSRVLLIRV